MLIQTAVEAAVAFAATNIDDLFLLIAWFGHRRNDRGSWEVAAGQALGIGALFAVSALGARGAALLPGPLVGALGFLPLGLGLHAFLRRRRTGGTETEPADLDASQVRWRGLLAVAAVTVANGGDNVAVYVPLLARIGVVELAVYALIFTAMLLIWLVAAQALAGHPLVARVLARHGDWLVPMVLIGLGVVIIAGSPLPAWVLGRWR